MKTFEIIKGENQITLIIYLGIRFTIFLRILGLASLGFITFTLTTFILNLLFVT